MVLITHKILASSYLYGCNDPIQKLVAFSSVGIIIGLGVGEQSSETGRNAVCGAFFIGMGGVCFTDFLLLLLFENLLLIVQGIIFIYSCLFGPFLCYGFASAKFIVCRRMLCIPVLFFRLVHFLLFGL